MQKIMFNDKLHLTKAVLDGSKIRTWRKENLSGQFKKGLDDGYECRWEDIFFRLYNGEIKTPFIHKPRFQVGEVIAIAQDYITAGVPQFDKNGHTDEKCAGNTNKMFVRAELMPTQIQITDVKVCRLQDLTDEECLMEGIRYIEDLNKYYFQRGEDEGFYFDTAHEAFEALIIKLNGKSFWESNPWGVAYKFKRIK